MSNPRAAKVAERIQQIIARRLEKGLRDPRLGFVTITDVRVTGDLQHASVFYTVYGTEEELADTAAALKAATGMMRSEVGKQLGTRLTPELLEWQKWPEATIRTAEAKVLTTQIAIDATNKLFELAGTRSTLAQFGLDRHWRNARVHTLHDPVRWKYQLLGNWVLNGIPPQRHDWN